MNKTEIKRLAREIVSDVLEDIIENDGIQYACEKRELNLSEEEQNSLEQAIYTIILQLRQ